MTYQAALAYLYSFADFEQQPSSAYQAERFDLRRVERLLHRLGDPHLGRLTVHIAGTKGKGSVAAMMAAVLEEAGFRTGLLTSPHLCSFRERIRAQGRAISEAALADAVERLAVDVQAYHGNPEFGKLTTFELSTVLAFMHFQQTDATAQVLEVGLGGRLDATNVIPKPDVCVITPISYDHTEVLGGTLGAIAAEKAGIIKPGVPVVMAPQAPEARAVIGRRAYELGCPIVDVGRLRWTQSERSLDGQQVVVVQNSVSVQLEVPLLGRFQAENAAVVVATVRTLREQRVPLTTDHLRGGLARVRWPGRLQVLERNPLLVLDGAHNGASALRLAEAVREELPHERCIIVIGTSADKDVSAIAAALAPVADRVFATRSEHARAAAPETIAAAFGSLGVANEAVDSVAEALTLACASAGPQDMVCVTGSLFVVGDALSALGKSAMALDLTGSDRAVDMPSGVLK